MQNAKPHALFARPTRPDASRVIFDTGECPAEAGLYGDEMKLAVRTLGAGHRYLTLSGPEGEIELEQTLWRRVMTAMALPPSP